MTNTDHRTLLIGLSGPSSSGKTTLARLLRSICNTTTTRLFILHQDDFYKTDTDIPRKTFWSAEHGARELDDWDCADAVDVPLFRRTLEHVKAHAALPDDMFSKEDQNSVGPDVVGAAVVEALKQEFAGWIAAKGGQGQTTICLLDGFLLYPARYIEESSARAIYDVTETLLDRKLFVPCTRAQTVQRRAARSGYVTLEGFWADPPGFVEDVVWPNFARYHAWMFRNERDHDNLSDGKVDLDAARQAKIEIAPQLDMKELLGWGVRQIQQAIEI